MPYTLLATGDLMLQRPIVRADAVGMAEVWRAFAAVDHVFANLEVVLTRRGEASDKLVCLRADPELADEVAAAHIGIVSAANNHALDYGHSWKVISPDLTTNDPKKQESSGGPIVVDNTAAEFYNTLLTIAPSRVQKGVIWAGADDGPLQHQVASREEGVRHFRRGARPPRHEPRPPPSWGAPGRRACCGGGWRRRAPQLASGRPWRG